MPAGPVPLLTPLLTLLLTLLLTPPVPAQQAATHQDPVQDAAAPIAHYQVDGVDTVVTRGDVALEMAFHLRRKDDGRAACTQLVKSTLVRRAAARAGVWPSQQRVQQRWQELLAQLRAAGRDLDREPILRNCSEAALLDYLAVDLAHEQIVRKELGLRADEQVSPAMLELWSKEAIGRAAVVDDPDLLPLGTAARVDGDDVPLLDLGILLLRSSDQAQQDKFVRQFVVLQRLEAMARKHEITVDDSDLQRELAACRAMADGDPRYGGLTFEQLLQAQGITPEWLLQSRVFRAQVLQKKLVARLHPGSELLAELAADRPAKLEQFGPRRHLAIIFTRAIDAPNQLVPFDFPAALAHLADVRKRLETDPFDTVAKIESDDPGTKMRGGDCGWLVRRARELPDEVLAAAFALRGGEVSQPIRSTEGCFLVKVLGIEADLDDDAIVARMREHLVETMTRDLLRDAAITRVDGTPLDGTPLPVPASASNGK